MMDHQVLGKFGVGGHRIMSAFQLLTTQPDNVLAGHAVNTRHMLHQLVATVAVTRDETIFTHVRSIRSPDLVRASRT